MGSSAEVTVAPGHARQSPAEVEAVHETPFGPTIVVGIAIGLPVAPRGISHIRGGQIAHAIALSI